MMKVGRTRCVVIIGAIPICPFAFVVVLVMAFENSEISAAISIPTNKKTIVIVYLVINTFPVLSG